MIKIYRKDMSDSSSKKAVKWLEKYGLPYQSLTRFDLSDEDLLQILRLSEGFSQILRSPIKATRAYRNIGDKIDWEDLCTTELIKIIHENPSLLRTPIIFDDSRLVVGFNEDEIRVFTSRQRRNLQRGIVR